MVVPFGMTETEWNKFCDSQKCKHGNYCNMILGLCSKCREEDKHVCPKCNLFIVNGGSKYCEDCYNELFGGEQDGEQKE